MRGVVGLTGLAWTLFVGGSCADDAGQWELCKESTKDLLGVSAVRLSPYPVERGDNLRVTLEGTPSVTIPSDTGVQLKVAISFYGIHLTKEKFDLCNGEDVEGVVCPLQAGEPFTATVTYPIPDKAPSGVTVQAELQMEGGGVKYSCLETDVKIHGDESDRRLSLGAQQHQLRQQWQREEELATGHGGLAAMSEPLAALVNTRFSERQVHWHAEMSPRFEGYSERQARALTDGAILRGHPGFEDLPVRTYQSASAAQQQQEEEEEVSTPVWSAPLALASSVRAAAVTADAVWTGVGGGAPRFEEWANGLLPKQEQQQQQELVIQQDDPIPDSFDARSAWPECAALIGHARDQSDCGSCWAFASTEAFNDRHCIKSIDSDGGPDLTELSAEDTTACCRGLFCGLSMGCNGGQPGSAWKWFKNHGVVTGGEYDNIGTGITCKPYEFMPCAHHVPAGVYPACPDSEYPSPTCVKECSEAEYATPYPEDKHFATASYSLRSVEDIQRDIMTFGSATAAFTVYADFILYAGGVYEHVEGSSMGGHAVKVIGWGTDEESGKDYWLIVNSWNESWGEGGLFRILRGSNHCGIESNIVAGEA